MTGDLAVPPGNVTGKKKKKETHLLKREKVIICQPFLWEDFILFSFNEPLLLKLQ